MSWFIVLDIWFAPSLLLYSYNQIRSIFCSYSLGNPLSSWVAGWAFQDLTKGLLRNLSRVATSRGILPQKIKHFQLTYTSLWSNQQCQTHRIGKTEISGEQQTFWTHFLVIILVANHICKTYKFVCMYHFNQYSTGKAKTKDLTSHWSKYTWNPSVSNLDTVCGISNLSSTMIQALESEKCFIIFDVKNTKVDHATYQWPRRMSAWHSSGTRDGIRSACHKKLARKTQKTLYLGIAMGNNIGPIKFFPLNHEII